MSSTIITDARVSQVMSLQKKSRWIPPELFGKPPVLHPPLQEVINFAEEYVCVLQLSLVPRAVNFDYSHLNPLIACADT